MDLNFPIVIHKDRQSDYGVTVPDLPGCFSAGATMDEGLPIPDPSSIERHRRDARYRGGVWAVVSVVVAALPGKARRINITMPHRVVEAVDRFARAHHQTRSGLLTRAAAAYVAQDRAPRPRPARIQHVGTGTR
jgi:hypothetical protein